MTTTIKTFKSTDPGAPVISNNWGDLVAALDACLVTGYGLKTIDSITLSGTTATASISTGQSFTVGQVLVVAGATQAAYNGEHPVTAVTANSFSYEVTGSPASPASPATSLTAKVAPLDFEKVFTGTHKGVYRSKNVLSNRPYLRVDNSLDPAYPTSYCKFARVTMAESMTDADTFAGARAPFNPLFPTRNEVGTGSGDGAYVGWYKWVQAGNGGSDHGPGARNWVLIGDDRGFYFALCPGLGTTYSAPNNRAIYAFGDFPSFKAADGFDTLLCATDHYATAGSQRSTPWDGSRFEASNDFTGKVLMRDYSQVGGNVRVGFLGLNLTNGLVDSGRVFQVPFPNGPDFSLLLHPQYIKQENGHLRGTLPGAYQVCQAQPYPDMTLVDNVVGYPGRKFLLVCGYNSGATDFSLVAFDVTGPWR